MLLQKMTQPDSSKATGACGGGRVCSQKRSDADGLLVELGAKVKVRHLDKLGVRVAEDKVGLSFRQSRLMLLEQEGQFVKGSLQSVPEEILGNGLISSRVGELRVAHLPILITRDDAESHVLVSRADDKVLARSNLTKKLEGTARQVVALRCGERPSAKHRNHGGFKESKFAMQVGELRHRAEVGLSAGRQAEKLSRVGAGSSRQSSSLRCGGKEVTPEDLPFEALKAEREGFL